MSQDTGDESGEHAATQRLGDELDEIEEIEEIDQLDEIDQILEPVGLAAPAPPRPAPPPPNLKPPPRTDKLKALLAKSRKLSEAGSAPEASIDAGELPSLGTLEKDSEQTDELDAMPDDRAGSTQPEIAVPDMTSPDLEMYGMDNTQQMAAAELPLPGADDPDATADPNQGVSVAPPAPVGLVEAPLFEPPPPQNLPNEYHISEPLVPSGDYGIVSGIGEHSRSGEHVTRAVNRDPKRVVAAMIAVGTFAVVISAVLVVQNWVDPVRAMVWVGAAALASTLLMGLIAPWEHDGGRARAFMVRVMPGLMFACVAIMLAASWSTGSVRVHAVAFAPDDVVSMERILDDPSKEVAARGCQRYMSHHDDPTWWGRMLSIIADRPMVAATCLRDLSAERQAAVAGSLIDRWNRELLNDNPPKKDAACEMAVALTQLPVEPVATSAPLLDCTLSAADEATQACCGEALASTVSDPKQWASRVFEAAERIEGNKTPSGVFAMAFQPRELTKPQKEFAKAVQFDGVMGRGAALALVCKTMDQQETRVIQHLSAVLEDKCDVDVANLPSKFEVWAPICDSTIIEVEADRTRPPVDVLCKNTQETVVADAIATARRLLKLASEPLNEGLADSVAKGFQIMMANPSEDSMALMSPEERQSALMQASQGAGTVVFVPSKEERKRRRGLDEQSRKELKAWEERVAERMRSKKR